MRTAGSACWDSALHIDQPREQSGRHRDDLWADEVEFGARGDNPENAIPLRRAAGIAHWSPGSLPEHAETGLRETVFWSMPGLDPPDEEDRVNSSGAYGCIFDMCAVEVDDSCAYRSPRRHRPGQLQSQLI